MRRSAVLAPSKYLAPATLRLAAHATGLALLGVCFESAFRALAASVPRRIYEEPSFTWALFEERPAFLLPALLALLLGGASLTPGGRRRLGWPALDTIGGMRWVVLATTITLSWPYAAHPYNHYYDQAHLWDRGLVFLFMLLTLQSPAWIPCFCLQVLISCGQTDHPIATQTPITDEPSLRVLGIAASFALWNLVATGLRSRRGGPRPGSPHLPRASVETPVLVFAVLCLLASSYLYAAVSKLALGANPLDWVTQNHLENLFIGAYLNGWNSSLSEDQALELAELIRRLSVPIAAGSLTLELGMLFVLTRRWLTVALLIAITAMHLGILTLTGVFFWMWALIDACMAGWLLWNWKSDALNRMYSPTHAVLSLLLIVAFTFAFGQNRFAWWNTKWTTLHVLEALDRDGNVYLVDYSDFSPYHLANIWKQYAPSAAGAYGGTLSQSDMQTLESIEPEALKAHLDSSWAAAREPFRRQQALDEFMQRFFRNRNRNLERAILPLPAPPSIRMRNPRGGIPYRGQSPILQVRVRYVEQYYTGRSLYPLRDEIVHVIAIPPDPGIGVPTEPPLAR